MDVTMKRLTERTKDGYVTTCFWDTNTENGMYDLNEQLAEKCIDRLAAYEDTGLTPEEIARLVTPKPNAPQNHRSTAEWISVNDRLPNEEELYESDNFGFLCCVLVPEKGGTFYKARRIIFFDSLDKEWDCEGIIVTHWMNMPDYPTEE